MSTPRGWLLLVSLLLCVLARPPSALAQTRAHGAAVPRVVLPNGLVVLLAEDHKAPIVSIQLRYRTGTRDDPPGRSGLASLVPKLMMQATKHVGKGDYQRLFDAAGGYASGWSVSADRTVINVSVPSEQIALPLWLLSDQMGFFVERLDSDLLAEQLKTVFNQHAQSVDNVPAGRVSDLVASALYPPGHPYHRGWFDLSPALASISPDEVRAFVEAHYRPEQAILSIVGDFDSLRALALVRKYFGPIGKSGEAAQASADAPTLDHEVRIFVAARIELPLVTIAWPTAPSQSPDDAPLDLVAQALVGSRAGLLRWKLVDELKIAANVEAHQLSRAFGSEFYIRVTGTHGHSPRELVNAVDGVLGRLQTAPPDPFIAQGALTGYLLGPLLAVERASARADRYAECEEYGVQGSCLTHWLARYTSVKAEDLSAVAARQLPLTKRVVAEVYPAPEAPIAGEVRDSPPGGQ